MAAATKAKRRKSGGRKSGTSDVSALPDVTTAPRTEEREQPLAGESEPSREQAPASGKSSSPAERSPQARSELTPAADEVRREVSPQSESTQESERIRTPVASAVAWPRIALDATLWDEPTTGIGLYTHALYDALTRLGAKVERLGARHSGEAPRVEQSRTLYFLSELPRALDKSDAEIFHAVSNFNLPLMKAPGRRMVLTVHDVIPEVLPSSVSTKFRWQFRLWLTRSLQVADRIVCVSRTTREDLLRHFEVDAEKVHVVHNGVDHMDQVPSLDHTGEQYVASLGLPRDFILYAGSLDARKNVALVLDAVEQLHLRGEKPTLVLMGQAWFGSGPVERRIADLRARGVDLRPLGYLAPALFYALMKRASVFVFPSLYEGFGLPPLEAMRQGVPTIVSDAGALPEVCAEGALSVGAHDADALARAIARVLGSKEERARLSAAGRRQAAKFTWEAAALQLLDVYKAALSS